MKIKNIIYHDKEKPLWDIEVSNINEFQLNNGITLHNSISFTFEDNVLSTGIEPCIFFVGWKKTRFNTENYNKWEYYFIIYDVVKELTLTNMKAKGLENTDDYKFMEQLPTSVLDNDGKIGIRAKKIVEEHCDVSLLKASHNIDPFNKVDMMSTIQKWVDASISNTYNIKKDYPYEKVYDLIKYAHKQKLKSITIYRQGTREEIYTELDPKTYEKVYNKVATDSTVCKKRPEEIVYNCAPKRPDLLVCDIHHSMINGKHWIVFIGLHKSGKPFEIFAGEYDSEIMHVPKKLKQGYIRKVKRRVDGKRVTQYDLEIKIRNSEVVYKDISNLFMNVEYQALTRLISLPLRHGVYPRFIIEQLRKSSNFVSDFMAVVSRILSKYKIKDDYFIEDKNRNINCPMCGEAMINDGGCMKCSNEKCGYSRCD